MIDTHAHLNFSQYDDDRAAVLQRAWDQGLTGIILIGAGGGFASNELALAMAQNDPRLFATVGVHPCDVAKMSDGWLVKLQQIVADKKVVAVGEIGLDFHWDDVPRDVQEKGFRKQLCLAKDSSLPIIIHSRNSHQEVWQIIKEEGVPKKKGVFHCFSGDLSFAHEIIEQGFFLGIGGVVTFKNAKDLQALVMQLPLENLLLETDAPYLAPAPYRGKRNEPAYTQLVAEKIAELKKVSVEEVKDVTTKNAVELFSLGLP